MLFHAADENSKGVLTYEEIRYYIHHAPSSDFFLSYLKRQALQWKDLWFLYDSDKDGLINESDFVKLSQQRLRPLFEAENEFATSEEEPSLSVIGKAAAARAMSWPIASSPRRCGSDE